ncbi:glucosamine-6-phosphate deaminase [Xylanibacillus composti]|uniref:Glucosamine-6-phosphate deaminase n=1 Tax=Xylanibacillus composti TaxID=1572762 RepID=A0A8J4M265_9BACL|nr:glucosamine-6-phosphate deaminase [Xylanibacillus composti]MDT9726045.1 glucosamine-6-phosphate deaminase [Xylanibacillus composti]GIQ68810.1 glucosamine-6-phosphate deaminase [Xylanibacillus composti]
MRIIRTENYQELSRQAADMIQAAIENKPDCVLGLATGGTPIGTYQQLVERYREGSLDFSSVTTFNLDEYYGVSSDQEQSYHAFMFEHLFRHINVSHERIHIPFGMPEDIEKHCHYYEQIIQDAGGIDLQLLGIGENGHIGFNEPARCLQADTHLVQLSQETIRANSRYFPSIAEVPKQAITMGVRTIFQAKKIVLLASGANKADMIGRMLDGRITTDIPASLLKLHPDLTIIVDREAGSRLDAIA